jgi:Kdo2-lipid IVA lauroyltransferase/acyltransferase
VAENLPAGVAGRREPGAWAVLRPRLRRWRRYWVRDPLFGALYYALHYGCRLLPIDWCSGLGGWLGALNWRYRYKGLRARIESLYVTLSGGPPSAEKAQQASRRLFENLGRVMLEFSILDRLWPAGRIDIVGGEHLVAARAAGTPVVVMGLHLGNWEVIGPTIVALGFYGAKGFYLPPPSRFDEKLLVRARERYGAILFRPGIAGTRMAQRHLVEDRGILLFYGDEERRGHVSAPLFGRPIPARSNLVTIVRLAWASGAVIIPAHAERLDGARFRVTYQPPVDLAPEASGSLEDNVHRLDRIITPIVLGQLHHWYMLTEWRR